MIEWGEREEQLLIMKPGWRDRFSVGSRGVAIGNMIGGGRCRDGAAERRGREDPQEPTLK